MIGKFLREARDAAGMSQEEVSAKGRVNRSYLSQVERGLKSPTVSMFMRICSAIGVSASELIAKLESAESRSKPRRKS
jgi:transcriptional regulator with XRE-family HTH domain